MPRKYPIVIEGDWMQLIFRKAENRETALLASVKRWINEANQKREGDNLLILDPEGPQGNCTPELSIMVLQADGEVESIWTVPDELLSCDLA